MKLIGNVCLMNQNLLTYRSRNMTFCIVERHWFFEKNPILCRPEPVTTGVSILVSPGVSTQTFYKPLYVA